MLINYPIFVIYFHTNACNYIEVWPDSASTTEGFKNGILGEVKTHFMLIFVPPNLTICFKR